MNEKLSLRAAGTLLLFLAFALALVAPAPAPASLMAVSPDGKIVLGGSAFPGSAAVARLEPDGSLDPSFGSGGIAIDRRLVAAGAIGVQADGGVVVATRGGRVGPFLGRLNADGSADPTFHGGAGTVENPFPSTGAQPVAILPGVDGERLAIAVQGYPGKYDVWPWEATIERRSASGVSEGSFGTLPSHSAFLKSVAELGDGSLVGAANGYEQRLYRYLPGGGADPGFGEGRGYAAFPTGYLESVAADGSGFVAAGFTLASSVYGLAVSRYSADGVLDQSFGQEGVATVSLPGRYLRYDIVAAAVAPDGDVVLLTAVYPQPVDILHPCSECTRAAVVRLLPDGTPDPAFGSGGVAEGSGPLASFEPQDLAVLGDGKILLGSATMQVARLNGDGSFDSSFGEGGVAQVFPCGRDQAEWASSGCVPRLQATLRVKRLRGRRPRLSLRVRPDVEWAEVRSVRLKLPRALRFHLKRRQHIYGHVPGHKRVIGKLVGHRFVSFYGVQGSQLNVTIGGGAFGPAKRLGRRQLLRFRVTGSLGVPGGLGETTQTAVVRRRVGG